MGMHSFIIAVLMLIIVVLGSIVVFPAKPTHAQADSTQHQRSEEAPDNTSETLVKSWPTESKDSSPQKAELPSDNPVSSLQRSPQPGILDGENDNDLDLSSEGVDDGQPITSKPWEDFNLKLSIPTTWLAYANENQAQGSVAGWYLPNRAEGHLYLIPKAHHNLNTHQLHGLVSYLSEAELSGPDWDHHNFFSVNGANGHIDIDGTRQGFHYLISNTPSSSALGILVVVISAMTLMPNVHR